MKAAAIQASPVFPMDCDATVDKACSLIAEAGRNGAMLVVLPETFVPMYPNWSIDLQNPQEWARNLVTLTKNAVELGGPQVLRLRKAARQAGAYVCIGVNERTPRYEGLLFNSLLFIDAGGELLGVHRKLTPSNRERCFWARGDGTTLRVYDTAAGRIGGLICYEHLQPLNKYMLISQGEQVHCACWPGWPSFPNGRDNRPVIDVATRAYALEGQCFVVAACMYVDPTEGAGAGLGNASWTFFGGSSIIGPEGDYLAGPVHDREDILYAELDFDRITLRKAAADIAGKDNRWDIMRVESNAVAYAPLTGSFGSQLASTLQLPGQESGGTGGRREEGLLRRPTAGECADSTDGSSVP